MSEHTVIEPAFEVLSETSHRDIGVLPDIDFAAFASLTQTSVTVSEFAGLSCSYPLFFIKDPQFGSFQSIALLSLFSDANHENTAIAPELNPYFHTGDGRYIASLPTSLMLHPFSLVHDPADETKLAMGVNINSGLIQPDGKPLFNADGSITPYLQTVEHNLSQYFNDQLLTQNVTDQLLALDLLQEFDVQINLKTASDKQHTTTLKGLYNINEATLMQLNDKDKLGLMNNGILPAIYAMLASISQLNRLIQLHNLQFQAAEQRTEIADINVKPSE